jgi:hypothetical protein
MKNTKIWVAMLFGLATSAARAEVVDSAPGGFTVTNTLTIRAAPEEVYQKLVRNVGEWWSSDHTFSHDSHNLRIEENINGCFCEKLPNGGGVRHMDVAFLAPGKTLVLRGGLGPLLSLAATGSMSFQLSPAEGATKLEVTYVVTGYMKEGLNTYAAPFDTVLKEQLTRLQNYIERGDPSK